MMASFERLDSPIGRLTALSLVRRQSPAPPSGPRRYGVGKAFVKDDLPSLAAERNGRLAELVLTGLSWRWILGGLEPERADDESPSRGGRMRRFIVGMLVA